MGVRLGFLILAHRRLDRVAQVARHLACQGAFVVVHVDSAAEQGAVRSLGQAVAGAGDIAILCRRRTHWGSWGLVEATRDAATRALACAPDLTHLCLISGDTIPLRPVADLAGLLASQPGCDFIDARPAKDLEWTTDGLATERFTRFFPFDWKRQRRAFDRTLAVQRRFGIDRAWPVELPPHIGSQWWCLTRRTIEAILDHPDRRRHDRLFRRVWIPDEAYFQTLTVQFGKPRPVGEIVFARFAPHGRPYTFYDDHLGPLAASGAHFARKIWPGADALYDAFTGKDAATGKRSDALDHLLNTAEDRALHGRATPFLPGRAPRKRSGTAAPYAVLWGLHRLWPELDPWLRQAGLSVHGRLFAPDGAQFEGREPVGPGNLSGHPDLRDADPLAFLKAWAWNARGRQCFQLHPGDRLEIAAALLSDPNATVFGLAGPQPDGITGAEARFFTQAVTARHGATVRLWSLREAIAHRDGILDELARFAGRPRPRPDPVLHPDLVAAAPLAKTA